MKAIRRLSTSHLWIPQRKKKRSKKRKKGLPLLFLLLIGRHYAEWITKEGVFWS